VALPPLPEGRYRIFAEATNSVGFTLALSGSVVLPESRGGPGKKPDGMWMVSSSNATGLRHDQGLHFSLAETNGKPSIVNWPAAEAADAFVLRANGEWVHVRPWGTVSAAAIGYFAPGQQWTPQDPPGAVTFPYPLQMAAGDHVWVTVKTTRGALTGAF
jgi:hypothetical protein